MSGDEAEESKQIAENRAALAAMFGEAEKAVSYWGCGLYGSTGWPCDLLSAVHSWAQEPQTITTTTMSLRPSTVDTCRAKAQRSFPHAGHLWSRVIGCPPKSATR